MASFGQNAWATYAGAMGKQREPSTRGQEMSSELGTKDALIAELDLEEQLDASVDNCLKRLESLRRPLGRVHK
jgi:hypothetical protein